MQHVCTDWNKKISGPIKNPYFWIKNDAGLKLFLFQSVSLLNSDLDWKYIKARVFSMFSRQFKKCSEHPNIFIQLFSPKSIHLSYWSEWGTEGKTLRETVRLKKQLVRTAINVFPLGYEQVSMSLP